MTNEQLKGYDFYLLLDKSGSMALPTKGGKTRWDEAKEATIAFASKISQIDSDGIDVVTFAGEGTIRHYQNVTDGAGKVDQIFQENEPNGGTYTHDALKLAFDNYFNNGKKKPIIVLVITDGEPSYPEKVASTIVEATKKMEKDEEIGVQFLQIGNDSAATAYLKRLDDDLVKEGAKFDIVDTKTSAEFENMTIADVLVAALED